MDYGSCLSRNVSLITKIIKIMLSFLPAGNDLYFFCNSWALFLLTIYIHLYIGAIPLSHVLEWLCRHEGRVYGESIFFKVIVLPGIREVYLRPIHSAAVVYPYHLSIRSLRADIPLPILGRSGLPCPLWGVLHEHTQVVAHSLVPPCRLLWFPLRTS